MYEGDSPVPDPPVSDQLVVVLEGLDGKDSEEVIDECGRGRVSVVDDGLAVAGKDGLVTMDGVGLCEDGCVIVGGGVVEVDEPISL